MVPYTARRKSAQFCSDVARAQHLPFRIDEPRKRGRHSNPHVGPFASGKSFRSGETVNETGIYEVNHRSDHRPEHEVVLLKEDTFPPCETCAGEVRFRLIRTAPYIFQDEDFEES